MSEPQTKSNAGLTFLGIFLAIGFICSSLILSNTFKTVKLSNQAITVKGYAEKRITSDLAAWSGEFSTSSKNLVGAYQKLQGDLVKVLNYLQGMGLKKEYVQVSSVNTMKRFRLNDKGISTNELEGFTLGQTIKISSSDVKLIEKISNEATDLIKEGVEFISLSPQYFYTKINDLKIEMLGAASKDARARADQLAKNSGGEVGSLKSSSQGVFQITPVNSTEIADYGMYDLTSIEKVIKSVVTVDYTIR